MANKKTNTKMSNEQKKITEMVVGSLFLCVLSFLLCMLSELMPAKIWKYYFIFLAVINILAIFLVVKSQKRIKSIKENNIGLDTLYKYSRNFKGVEIILVILFILASIFYFMVEDIKLNDRLFCKHTTECVDNGNGVSSCYFIDTTINCSTELLKTEQFQK